MERLTFIDIHCINLKRSGDRYQKMLNEFNNININMILYNAIDGTNYENIATNSEKNLFNNCDFNDYKNANNIKCCALSHIRLIRSFLNLSNDYYIISEDDFRFINNGSLEIIKTLIYMNDKKWDIIFFPYKPNELVFDDIPKKINKPQWLGAGNVLYIINKNAPQKINNFINQFGLKRALDWFYLDNIQNGLNVWLGPNIIELLDTNSDIHN